MEHSFDIDIAKEYGINCAILLKNIYFWIEKNKANEKNFNDGEYWTYNSIKAFSKLFIYMSEKQIRTSLAKLESEGILITGNYNKLPYDKTKWYAITPKGYNRIYKRAEGHIQKGEPIPDSKPDSKPNININSAFEELFEKVWELYPNKKGKGQVSATQKKKLYSIGYEKLKTCVERYTTELKKENEKIEWKKSQNGSTFFNSGYVDYLDENYVEAKKRKKVRVWN